MSIDQDQDQVDEPAPEQGRRRGRRLARRMQNVQPTDDQQEQRSFARRGRRRQAVVPAAPDLPDVRGRDDAPFHPGRLDIVETPPSPITFRVLVALASMFACALAWGFFGKISSTTSAAGKVQVTGRTKVLEALAVGKVTKIRVRDGAVVKTGDTLIELDPTEAQAERTIIDQKLTDLRAETLRQRVEIGVVRAAKVGDKVELDVKAKIPWAESVPAAVRRREEGVAQADLASMAAQLTTLLAQKRAAEAERDKYVENIKAQKALVGVTQENMTMIEGLTQRGYNSQAKYLDFKAKLDGQKVALTGYEGSLDHAKQAIGVIDSQIASTRESFVTATTQTVATSEQTIVDLAQKLIKADQALDYMTLHAPIGGVIHANAVTTLGQVVKRGQQLMQIVPKDAPLEIQTYVSNTDIGFLRVGDPATIKVSAFTYGVYGGIDGKVTSVAKDALAATPKDSVQTSSLDGEYKSTTTAQKTGSMQFPVTVRADKNTMRVEGKDVPLVPGMSVNVEIETERRRALDYLISPILELLSTAGHEK